MQITDAAKQFIQTVMSEQQANTIRVVFAGMGWGGPKLGLALDEPHETDKVEVINEINVAIEEMVIQSVQDITLDYQKNDHGQEGLVIVGSNDCC